MILKYYCNHKITVIYIKLICYCYSILTLMRHINIRICSRLIIFLDTKTIFVAMNKLVCVWVRSNCIFMLFFIRLNINPFSYIEAAFQNYMIDVLKIFRDKLWKTVTHHNIQSIFCYFQAYSNVLIFIFMFRKMI